MASIDEGLKSANCELIVLNSHTIKSVAALVGASRMESLSAQIENLARSQKLEPLPEKFTQLSSAWDATAQAFSRYLKKYA